MTIPLKTLQRLHYGKEVAAEVTATEPNMRAFVSVIPQVPDKWKHPEAYIYRGENVRPEILRDPSLITGYEIRWLKHDAKYTHEDWAYDYDQVLAAKTTRVKRVFIRTEEDIKKALAPWLTDMSDLRDPLALDSGVVGNLTSSDLDRPQEYFHLWSED